MPPEAEAAVLERSACEFLCASKHVVEAKLAAFALRLLERGRSHCGKLQASLRALRSQAPISLRRVISIILAFSTLAAPQIWARATAPA